MQGKDLKKQLKSLIRTASSVDANLEKRLEEINRWLKDAKPGSIIAKKFLSLFLRQIIQDAQIWLLITEVSSPEEQEFLYQPMTPTERYWYSYLFPKWLNDNDPKFYIWRSKLMSGEFEQKDKDILKKISDSIQQRQGTVLNRYIVDLSMATDLIVSSSQGKPLCIQLTTLSEEFSQAKYQDWEKTLLDWGIERGLFLSYLPSDINFINQMVNIALYNSENLKLGAYLKFHL